MIKKQNLSISKILMLVIIALIICVITSVLYNEFIKSDNNIPIIEEIPIVDNIESFGYILTDNKTTYYKNLFNDLKDILNKDEIDYDVYSEVITKLFISDVLNLDNKISNTDIGGVQFVYGQFKEDFINIAKSTLYNYVKSNVYNDRVQELPIVEDVVIDSKDKKEFKYNDFTFKDAYYYNVVVKYKKDLGYQKEYQIIVVKNSDRLEIAKMQANNK
ncbi:MAG TPA: hypothetical protein GX747_03695 [Tenericutes bacterium]|nr:hypothetical protein [Mycoplasmatota bacterium]